MGDLHTVCRRWSVSGSGMLSDIQIANAVNSVVLASILRLIAVHELDKSNNFSGKHIHELRFVSNRRSPQDG